MGRMAQGEACERQVRGWLLALLRFAITQDERDRIAAHQIADEMDANDSPTWSSGPTFFARTTRQVCEALQSPDEPQHAAALNQHIGRINDARLRAAFEAVVGHGKSSTATPLARRRRPLAIADLWKGLPAR